MSMQGVIATDLTLNWVETIDHGFEHATGGWSITRRGSEEPVSLYHNARFVLETDLATAVYFVMRREDDLA